jgi:hypothetical protein
MSEFEKYIEMNEPCLTFKEKEARRALLKWKERV